MCNRKKTVTRPSRSDAASNAVAAVILVPVLIVETIFGIFTS
jgi:hypothetical protein